MFNVRKAVGYAVAFAAVVVLTTAFSYSFADNGAAGDANQYMGVGKCKTCHNTAAMGKQLDKWAETKHAKAYETLATDEAKKIAKEKGVDDPQKDEKCLKCHVTASGEKAENLGKDFDKTKGIQCEACHGPGKKHIDARNEDEGEVSDDEIIKKPTEESCKKCHNPESPTFKAFDFKAAWEKIKHPKK